MSRESKEDMPVVRMSQIPTIARNSDHFFNDEFNRLEMITEDYEVVRVKNKNSLMKLKNRYKNVLPGVQDRVLLKELDSDPETQYINANYAWSDLSGDQRRYIATQAPVRFSMGDFWRMIWENDCSVVVMLTKLKENGKRKAEKYWNTKKTKNFEGITVSVLSEEELHEKSIIRRVLEIEPTDSNEEPRRVVHLQYLTWPDFATPPEMDKLENLVNIYRELANDQTGCVVVHCSAGLGRSGTFIAIDIILSHIHQLRQNGDADPELSILEIVSEIRKHRPGSVQNANQYSFIYEFVGYCIENGKFI